MSGKVCQNKKVQPGPGNATITPILPPSRCILGFLPSFPDLSLLLRTELHTAGRFLPCPCPSVATRVGGFAPLPAWSEQGLFQNWKWRVQKYLSSVLTAEIWDLARQPLACGPLLWGIIWSKLQASLELLRPGQTMLCPPWLPECRWVWGAVHRCLTPDCCNLWIITVFLTLQGGTLQCLKC